MYINKNIDDKWFFSKPGWYFRIFEIYVNGDIIAILPVIIAILIIGIFSWKFMILMSGIYLSFRGLGETIYWLLHQFIETGYRPKTQYKKLSNKAVYILYQTAGLRNSVLGAGIVLFSILYLY